MANFKFFKMAAAAILDFQNFKFLTAGKSVEPLTKYGDFRLFQDNGRPPSWICNAYVGTNHEWHLVVFITVQNLVGIDAVVLKICTFFDFESSA